MEEDNLIMRLQRILGLSLLLALLSITLLTWLIAPASADVLHVPSVYPTIQSAVDAASPGDTIQVAAGIYPENVVVTCRQITIVGENPLTTIVDGEEKDTVFNIKEDDVEICNLTIRNGGQHYNGIIIFYPYGGAVIRNNRIMHNRLGIVLSESSDNTIEGNVLLDNSLYGITARDYSNNIIIKDNTISESAYGIELSEATLSQVVNNAISDASYGVYLAYSNNNNVSANTLNNNSWNIYLAYSNSNIVGNNAISGGAIGIQTMRSNDNSVFNNTVGVDSYGIYFGYCGPSTISGNAVSQGDWGIELYNSAGSTIKENMISENTWGIYVVVESDGNSIYHNDFIDNVDGAYQDPASQNTWRTPSTPYQGNYWSDYKGEDTDDDGIGNTYLPWEGVDWYPLMEPWGIVYVHDVAIVEVSPEVTLICRGFALEVNVTATNEGDTTESFSVSAYANSTLIGEQIITDLHPNADLTLSFNWDTTDAVLGNYTLSATAETVQDETDVADNSLVDGVVKVKYPGDVNEDGIVDLDDVYLVSAAFGTTPGMPGWDPRADVAPTYGFIDLADMYGVIQHFGETH